MDLNHQGFDELRIKQEPPSSASGPRSKPMLNSIAMEHNHDTLAMQQTYCKGENPATDREDEEKAIDMSYNIINFGNKNDDISPTFTAKQLYGSDSLSIHSSSNQSPSPVSGMYVYSSTQDGKSTKAKGRNNVKQNINQTQTATNDQSTTPKTRNSALPGMGKRSHLPKRYKCAMCAYRTRYKSDLNRHVRKHAVATYNCEICNMPFKTVGNVEFHKRKEHANAVVQPAASKEASMKHVCNYCTYETMNSSDLTRHLRKHYAAKFHCTICNRPFMTSGSLVQHKRTVHEMHDIELIMNPELTEPDNQTVKEEMDTADENSCGEIATELNTLSEASVLNLIKSRSRDEEKEDERVTTGDIDRGAFSCNNYVDNDGNTSSELLFASQNRTGKDDGNSISTENRMESPKQQDGDVESASLTKHTCKFCHKTFGRKLVLEYHLKNIHKFTTNQSETMFVEYPNDDYDLALDMSIQELENSTSDSIPDKKDKKTQETYCYQCQFCAYATNYKSTFDRHVKKHDLECHICIVCRMPFITFGHLQRHIRDNHPDHIQSISKKEVTNERQSCSYCNFMAETLSQLQLHCQMEHGLIIGQKFQRKPSVKRNEMPRSHSYQYIPADVEIVNDDVNFIQSKEPEKVEIEDNINGIHEQSFTEFKKISEEDVTVSPPPHGRYAKLVSDYENFAERPFACALCFFRTSDLNTLIKHAENHLTGCNPDPVPETAVFSVNRQPVEQVRPWPTSQTCCNQKSFVPCAYHSTSDGSQLYPYSREYQNDTKLPCDMVNDVKMQTVPFTFTRMDSHRNTSASMLTSQKSPTIVNTQGQNRLTNRDRLIPTFSVHYRKDKTNKVRPYLCLLCRKRFKHLTILKQHFKLVHNDFHANTKPFTCQLCNREFDNPMMLQEHHDVNH